MRVHLIGLPHLDTVRAVEWCAYSQKLRRLCDMLSGLGHEVILYSGPENEAAVKEHVVVVTEDDREHWFGETDWRESVFNAFDPMSAPWVVMNSRAAAAMAERIRPGDIIGLTMGQSQGAIQQAFPNHIVAEVGVGYEGVLGNTHRCFESEAWRHYIYGKTGVADGRYYDVVVPNSYDPSDYLHIEHQGEYLLYLGRMTPRKGLAVVGELAKRFPVVTAGQGGERVPGAAHRGLVTGWEKAHLIAYAAAVLVPTDYIEPFGGVAVEAMLSGVPVITSPWGAFSETVLDWVSGQKCYTLAEFIEAAQRALDAGFDSQAVRGWALGRYTLDAVAPQYDRWLRRLEGLYGAGWYA